MMFNEEFLILLNDLVLSFVKATIFNSGGIGIFHFCFELHK